MLIAVQLEACVLLATFYVGMVVVSFLVQVILIRLMAANRQPRISAGMANVWMFLEVALLLQVARSRHLFAVVVEYVLQIRPLAFPLHALDTNVHWMVHALHLAHYVLGLMVAA